MRFQTSDLLGISGELLRVSGDVPGLFSSRVAPGLSPGLHIGRAGLAELTSSQNP